MELQPVRRIDAAFTHPHPRAHVLGARRRASSLLRRPPLAVHARRTDWPAAGRFRGARAHRSAAGLSRARSAIREHRRQYAGRVLPGPPDSRLGRARRTSVGARRHPGLRRPHRPSALGVSHDPASGRARIRHLAEGRLALQWRRQRVGRPRPRRAPGLRLRVHGLGRLRLLRRQSAWRQPVREHDAVPAGRHRRAGLALPGGQARRVGSRLPRPACARHAVARRTAAGRRGSDRQERPDLCPRARHWPLGLSARRDRRARLRRPRRATGAPPGAAGAAPAVHPAALHRGL